MNTQQVAFQGETYEPVLDHDRLKDLKARVLNLMQDGEWRTFQQIQAITGGGEASISARLRDFRKFPMFLNVERRRVGDSGLFEYRIAQTETISQESVL